ncbi:MAG: hypothetical protein LBH39_01610 [Clostridiales Family XIII bacterium]|jgi:hypothetical protein|nr:hypothetical protein [Clostridiales Family XIII bacterium]
MTIAIDKRTYAAIYRLLNRVSPIDGDCGRLCGSACCRAGDDEAAAKGQSLGIYLLPGEDALFTKNEGWIEWGWSRADDSDFPDSWEGLSVYFIKCGGVDACHREIRPLQCRFFPLAPHLTRDGRLWMILYPDKGLPYSCPLIKNKTPLSRDFVKASYTVWNRLMRDPLIYDLVKYDSSYRSRSKLVFIYPDAGRWAQGVPGAAPP